MIAQPLVIKTNSIRPTAKYECIGALTFFWCF